MIINDSGWNCTNCTSTTIPTSLATSTVIQPLAKVLAPLYGQCGGVNYTGSLNCRNGSSCFIKNQNYSQCLTRCPSFGWQCSNSSFVPLLFKFI